jgi:hypothetical protein
LGPQNLQLTRKATSYRGFLFSLVGTVGKDMGLTFIDMPSRSSAFSRAVSRNGGIDFLKIFCAIAIVFFHVLPDLGLSGELGPDRFYTIVFGSWGVYASAISLTRPCG